METSIKMFLLVVLLSMGSCAKQDPDKKAINIRVYGVENLNFSYDDTELQMDDEPLDQVMEKKINELVGVNP